MSARHHPRSLVATVMLLAACHPQSPAAPSSSPPAVGVVEVSARDVAAPVVGEFALVPPGVALFVPGQPQAPALTVGGTEPLVVMVEALDGADARVALAATDEQHCGRVLKQFAWVKLSLTVAVDELAFVVQRHIRKDHTDGTWIELVSGAWLDGPSAQSAVLGLARDQPPVQLPVEVGAADIVRSYARNQGNDEPPPEQLDSDDEVSAPTPASLGGEAVTIPRGASVGLLDAGPEQRVLVSGRCARAVLAPDRPVALADRPRRYGGQEGMMGRPEGPDADFRYRVRSGATVVSEAGQRLGRASRGLRVDDVRQVGNRLCIAAPEVVDWFSTPTPLCFDAADVMVEDQGWPSGSLVLPGEVRVDGQLSPASAAQAMEPFLENARYCYAASVNGGTIPEEAFRVELTLSVGSDGRLESIALQPPELPAYLLDCIEGATEELSFPSGSRGKLSQSLRFEP